MRGVEALRRAGAVECLCLHMVPRTVIAVSGLLTLAWCEDGLKHPGPHQGAPEEQLLEPALNRDREAGPAPSGCLLWSSQGLTKGHLDL